MSDTQTEQTSRFFVLVVLMNFIFYVFIRHIVNIYIYTHTEAHMYVYTEIDRNTEKQ